MTTTIFKAYHKPSKEWYWFDALWGNVHGLGGGYIGMVPLGEEIKFGNRENRIGIDPDDCQIFPFHPKTLIVYKDGSYKFVEPVRAWEYENDSDWLATIPLSEINNNPIEDGSTELPNAKSE